MHGRGSAGGNPILWQAVIWFLVGFSSAAIHVYSSYFLQLETPKELMGRVWSIASTMQNVFPFLGPAVGAVFMGWVGVGGVFLVAGGLYVLMGAAVGVAVRWLGIKVPEGGAAAGTGAVG